MPEYCEWAPKQFDLEECKKWLAAEDKLLYDKLYPAVEETGEESKQEPKKKKKQVKIQ